MERRAVVAALALCATAAWAKPKATPQKQSEPQEVQPAGPVTLDVRAIDPQRRTMLVEVAGLRQAPAPNFFTMTDERGRHFVAMDARCGEPFPSGMQACELEIPSGYERHRLRSLLLHVGSLKGRSVYADEGQIASAWDAAEAAKRP